MNLMTVAIVLAVAATLYSLIGGITSMVTHGEVRHHTEEQWMILRIAFQALVVVLLLVAFFLR